jgi:hypothetical protein
MTAISRFLGKRKWTTYVGAGLVLAAALLATACGSGSASTGGPGPGGGASSPMQVRIGDAPSDRVISFEVTVGPITLTPTSGTAVTVLAATRRIELTHLSGISEPLALLGVPQGSYSSATLTVQKPEITFLNNLGVVTKIEPAFNQAITVNFGSPITIGPSSSVLNIDLSVANALTFDGLGNVTGVNLSASSFTFSSSVVAAEDHQHPEDGEMEDISGKVTSVSGNSFTMTVGQSGAILTFVTDANTEFKEGATLATLANMMVTVEGSTRADGTLYAKEVEGVENENGAELEGNILQVTGNPATELSILTQDGQGSGVDDTKVGTTLTADVSGAQYRVSKGNIDTSGIGSLPAPPNFPFDASTVHAGQRVEVDSASTLTGTSLVAEKVKLQQQTLTGTVSGLPGATSAGPVTFTLTLPADSAFATLSGKTTVTIFWQGGTDLHKLTSVNNGDTVRVRSLVFFAAAQVNAIARRISQ